MTKLKNNTSKLTSANTLKINLVAPPSRGKTSISYKLAATLSLDYQIPLEVVTEYSKELIYEGVNLDSQTQAQKKLRLEEQMRREQIFFGKVPLIITSSPILIQSLFFNNEDLEDYAREESKKWNEIYFFLEKDDTYEFQKLGRPAWTAQSSQNLEKNMKDFCHRMGVPLISLSGSPDERVNKILNILDLI